MVRTRLLALLVCLRCDDRIRETPKGQDAVQELACSIAKIIAPTIPRDESPGNDSDLPAGMLPISLEVPLIWHSLSVAVVHETFQENRDKLAHHCMAFSGLGIQALEALMKHATSPLRLDDEVLLTLLVCADSVRSFAHPEHRATATRLLEQQFSVPGSTKDHFIAEVVLRGYLRSLFSRSKPASITASGRKEEYADGLTARGDNIPDDSALTKPWKYTDLRSIPAAAWAVREADVSSFRIYQLSLV